MLEEHLLGVSYWQLSFVSSLVVSIARVWRSFLVWFQLEWAMVRR